MTFFNTAIKVLTIVSAFFFVLFSYTCLLWTGRNIKKPRNIFGAAVISLLTTFKILIIGFGLVVFVSFFIKFVSY